MRVVCFINNRVGYEVLRWLTENSEDVVGIVVHPAHKAKFSDEILGIADAHRLPVLDGSRLKEPETYQKLAALRPDLFLSVLFEYIFPADLIDVPAKGTINLHNGYLPFNRGTYANVWSIVERTPAGATLHYIDAGIDTGDIIAKKEVPVAPEDTGQTLYAKIEQCAFELFKETWTSIVSGQHTRTKQSKNEGSSHRKSDVGRIDRIDLNQAYVATNLIDILRARTFPPYEGAYFEVNGEKYYVSVSISKEKT